MSKNDAMTPSINCAKDGPYIVKNLSTFTGLDGAPISTESVMALCRCGQSNKRPFCDGTHASVGFTGDRQSDRVADKRESYQGKQISIQDNRGICSHAAYCTEQLSEVFRSGVEPWIDPDGAEVSGVDEVVRVCPSGALSYSREGKEHLDQERESAVHITPHGPYCIEGGVELQGVNWLAGASKEHFTLCRCGHSRNKPFCDGSHWAANYRDDQKHRVAMLSSLEPGKPLEVDVEGVTVVVRRDGGGAAAVSKYSGQPLELTIEDRWGEVLVDLEQIRALRPQTATGAVQTGGSGGNREEPFNEYIRALARHGLSEGEHGPMAAMGVPCYELPTWDDLQFLTAQLQRLPQLDDVSVETELVIGRNAKRPLRLAIPLFVSDMSFGALSLEAKVALAKGAELAETGICSGEGGMLPEEQEANTRYFYELASARFGFSFEQLEKVQAFHFKGGQGAKTGTGGHLPACKVTEKIAAVRGLPPGQDAISPARFPDWESLEGFREFADEVRAHTGGIPIGFKLSAQHIEKDIDAALSVGVDYIILDGRGGGTGAAPLIFRDNISVPTLPALARARRHLDRLGADHVALIITGGLRTPADFAKALALGADGVALANSAIQAIGCIGARRCNTNTCPAGIATQDENLRQLVKVEEAAQGLQRFLQASTHLMSTMARACGHTRLSDLCIDDLTTWKREVAYLTGVGYGGVVPLDGHG